MVTGKGKGIERGAEVMLAMVGEATAVGDSPSDTTEGCRRGGREVLALGWFDRDEDADEDEDEEEEEEEEDDDSTLLLLLWNISRSIGLREDTQSSAS